jgi:medium-chain acyl-[acyl-carrier-protein] hydrolase
MMNQPNPWIIVPKPQVNAGVRLFCLPYAGGSSTVFRTWPDALVSHAEVALIQMPGRGSRYRETPLNRLTEVVQLLADAMTDLLDCPYMLLGHSLGGLISFELIRELRRRGLPEPLHLFVCARPAPHLPNERTPVHNASDDILIQEVQRRYGGIPPAILADAEMLQLFLPTLRADLEVLETYRYVPEAPLNCDITVYGGYQDLAVTYTQLAAWSEHTVSRFSHQMFPGNHFFVQNTPAFLKTFSATLATVRG